MKEHTPHSARQGLSLPNSSPTFPPVWKPKFMYLHLPDQEDGGIRGICWFHHIPNNTILEKAQVTRIERPDLG